MKTNPIFNLKILFETTPGLSLQLIPTAVETYLKATITAKEAISGQDFFEMFPDNSGCIVTGYMLNSRALLNDVNLHKQVQTIAIEKFDIRNTKEVLEERYQPVAINFKVQEYDLQL